MGEREGGEREKWGEREREEGRKEGGKERRREGGNERRSEEGKEGRKEKEKGRKDPHPSSLEGASKLTPGFAKM